MSLRMGSHNGSSRGRALDKRVPKNPRYARVKSKVETGMTVDKVTFITTRQHLRRQEEPFFRLTPSQLSELLNEYEQDQQEGVQDFRDHIDPDNHGPKVVEHDPDAQPGYNRPYLILDVRCPEEFKRSRIVQARSFEARLLNQDRMTPEMHMYKNREGALVVLYSNDDTEACHVATTLIHRGFDNVFVLSGGLTAFARGGFLCFVEGDTESLTPPATGGGRGGGGSGRGSVSNGSCASSCNEVSLGGSGESHRLDYRHRGGDSAVVRRGGGGFGRSNSTASKSGSVRGGMTLRASTGGGGGGVGQVRRKFGGYPGEGHSGDGGSEAAAVVPAVPRQASDFGGGDRGGGERPQNIAGLRGGHHGRGLAQAAAAASAARRRSLQGGEESGSVGRPSGGMSKGSAVTVADSVISRSIARRGRW